MREELDMLIGVGWGVCSPRRKGYRNGFYRLASLKAIANNLPLYFFLRNSERTFLIVGSPISTTS